MPITKNCLVCGKEYETTPCNANKRKYCSQSCVRAAFKKRVFSKEWRERISKSKKGQPASNKGKKGQPSWAKGLTKETDERIRNSTEKMKATKKRKYKSGELQVWNKGKKNWASKEQLQKALKALIKRPTKPERLLIELIQKNNLPYRYTGNGAIMIGRRNPDFIHNSEKKIIEVFGIKYHSKKHAFFKINKIKTSQGTAKFYNEKGYALLVLWDNEILYCPEEKLLQKINQFTGVV